MAKYDKYLSIFMIFISIIYYTLINSLPEKAGTYPYFVLCLLSIFSVILLIQSFISKENNKGNIFKGILLNQLLSLITLCIIYIFLINFLGFFSSTFLYLIGTMKLLNIKIKSSLGVSCGFCIFIYVIFVIFLKVPVPMGIFI